MLNVVEHCKRKRVLNYGSLDAGCKTIAALAKRSAASAHCEPWKNASVERNYLVSTLPAVQECLTRKAPDARPRRLVHSTSLSHGVGRASAVDKHLGFTSSVFHAGAFQKTMVDQVIAKKHASNV